MGPVGALRPGYQVTNEITLVRRLGAGGMGTVWLARHGKLDTDVVVKFLSESLASDEGACERFSREVSATVQVRSPHVVQTLDHGITESGIPYIVMELLEGEDLSKLIRQRSTLRPDEVQHIVDGVCAALTKAHDRGIVHRDIKPANIFLCAASPRPFVKLVDFGIAKRLEDVTMTATNALLGTPAYMSPEQMAGNQVDHRTDLWALGVLVYHTLTGTPPFRGAHVANIAHAILQEAVPKITTHRPDLHPNIDVWLERALARDPAQRFFSAQELTDSLADAFGERAYNTSRRHAGPLPVIIQAAPSNPVQQAPFDAVGATLGPSAITQTPYGSARRTTGWAIGFSMMGVVLVAIAFKIGVGYSERKDTALSQPPAAPTVLDPSATSTFGLPTTVTPGTPTNNGAVGTLIGASPSVAAPSVSTAVRPTFPGPTGQRPRSGKPATSPPKKTGRDDQDNIGF
jgi:eukaryotic-like serine/threonine-protein kinase